MSTPSRQKTDAEAQTVTELSVPRTPVKRVRFDDNHGDGDEKAPALKRAAIEISSPSGRKVVHINTVEFSPRAIDVVTDPWVSPDQGQYLYNLLNYRNLNGVWFPIQFLPPNSVWAVVDENPRVMHKTHRGRPLLIWIIGVFVEQLLAVTRSQPRPRLRVVIDFVRERDRAAVLVLHNQEASVPVNRFDSLTVMSPASDDEGLPTHLEVYDSRGSFEGKSPSKKISVGCIEGGDIVMVECTVVRTEDAGQAKTVALVLNSLYWLLEKPRPPNTVTQAEIKFPSVIANAVN